MGKWPVKFSERFDSDVWNIYALNSDLQLLIETRDSTEEKIEFFIISLDNPSVSPLPISDAPWFSQVVYADAEVVLIQQYDENMNPDRTGLLLFSIISGDMLWRRTDLRYEERGEGYFVCSDREGQRIAIDAVEGRSWKEDTQSKPDPGFEGLVIPVHYMEGTTHFNDVAGYLADRYDVLPVRAIDYMEGADYITISYYFKNGMNLGLTVIGMDIEGNIGLEETLEKDLNGIADPPYLFYQQNLIFVKEKRHFFVYALPKES